MAVVNDLVTKFSFKGSLNPLKMLNAQTAASITAISHLARDVISLGKTFSSLVTGETDAIRSMENLSYATGVSANKIREMDYAAQQMGANSGDVANTIDSLSQKINQAAINGDADFARLGISIRSSNGQLKKADQVMAEVSSRFKTLGLTAQQQRPLADSLGIDSRLLRMMNASSGEMAKLTSEARGMHHISKAQAKAAEAFSNATIRSRMAVSGLTAELALALAPSMRDSSKWLADLITDNKEWIRDALKEAVIWLGKMKDSLEKVAPVLAPVAVGMAAISIAASPLTATALLIAGLVLVVDDLVTAFQGGDSVIQTFFENMFGWDVGGFLRKMVADFKDGFSQITEFFKPLEGIFEWMAGGGLGVELARSNEVREKINANGGGQSSSNNVDNRQVNQTNNITVMTDDAKTAADETVRSLGREMKDADAQLNKGGQ